MKLRKLLSGMLGAALLVSMLAGCGGEGGDTASDGGAGGDTTTTGDGTPLELWTFQEVHRTFYEDMANRWNEANADKQVALTVSVQPFEDMHNKLTIALQSGEGAPDICDVEVNKFPTYLQGEVQFLDLTSYVDPYREDIVPARLEIYSKDGKNYGAPFHVGAMVAYYDTKILNEAGVDYTTIKTWDDYKEAGEKVKAAGYAMGAAETGDIFIYEAMLAALDSDMTDDDGNPTLNTPESIQALTTIQELAQTVDETIPGGSVDAEEGYGAINAGHYAAIMRPIWYMSRYPSYMENFVADQIAIAPMPVFDEADYGKSFGGGGTGTVVTLQSENQELAAEWLCYAKLSEEGCNQIWEQLGFDPCNMALWDDEAVTQNEDNQYISFFATNPFDVLNEVRDDIGVIRVNLGVPTVGNVLKTVTLPDVIENGVDPAEAAQAAQEQAENELGL